MGVVVAGPHPTIGVVVPRALLVKSLKITTACSGSFYFVSSLINSFL